MCKKKNTKKNTLIVCTYLLPLQDAEEAAVSEHLLKWDSVAMGREKNGDFLSLYALP